MLMPNSGNVLTKRGNKAQWMAQASEAEIPIAFQLIWSFMLGKDNPMQHSCKI